MENKHIALIVAGAALAIGGGVYFYKRSQQQKLVNSYGSSSGGGVLQTGNNIVDTAKNLVSSVSTIFNKNSTTNYEGKLVRVNKGKVYLIQNNLAHYVDKLPTPDGRYDWPADYELNSLPVPEGETYNQMMARAGQQSYAPTYQSGDIDPKQPWAGTMSGLGRLLTLITMN